MTRRLRSGGRSCRAVPRRMATRAAAATFLLAAPLASAVAQGAGTPARSGAAPARVGVQRAPADSLEPPLSPGRAFLYSFMLPGLAQGRLQHHFAGAIYVTVEAVAIAMLTKTANDLRIARAHLDDHVVNAYKVDPGTGAPIVDPQGAFVVADTVDTHYGVELEKARRTHYEDWVAILIFNHLFSGADAFVSSLLWDLPAEVHYRATPNGAGVGLRVRW